jgi:membrane-bound metal-dependent hydrolase YbcI (DUF457 family)
MKLPEHLAFSFLLAQLGVQQQYGPAGTALVLAAGCLPDLDGLTLLAGWQTYRTYHRVLGHGILVTFLGPVVLAAAGSLVFGASAVLPLWLWLQAACLGHLVTDFLFYRWPVQLLWPFSTRGWGFGLVSWNDLLPTLLLYGATGLALAWPAFAPLAAALGLGGLVLYLGWRLRHPRPQSGWAGWLTGGWVRQAAPFWKWCTGDFVT